MSANPRRARRARRTGLTLALVAGVASALLPALSAQADDPPPAVTQTLDHADAERAAALVAAEDRRLTEIRTVTSLARWQGKNWETPYRMTSGAGYTLVLTPRSEPYTVKDLLALAPQTFLRMSDGSYLLSENLVVSTRATLRLSQPGGLTVRLASGPRGFVSIVSVGGKIELAGEQEKPVRLESWDVDAGAPDTDQADGRAYVRAMGGSSSRDTPGCPPSASGAVARAASRSPGRTGRTRAPSRPSVTCSPATSRCPTSSTA